MPTPGREFGVDTDRQLRNIPQWAAVRAWRAPKVPVFVGRYFFPGHVWVDDESVGVRHAHGGNPPMNPDLAYVFPLQGPGGPVQTNRVKGKNPDGSIQGDADTVQQWGADDATSTCTRIIQVVKRGELTMPSSHAVIVYLDIEAGVRLSADYWYGWASKVYWFSFVSSSFPFMHFPFYPGLYCTTVSAPPAADPLLHRIPSVDVQGGLTKPPNNLASRCYGIYATNPQTPLNGRFVAGFQPDWTNRFDVWQQTVHIIFGLVPWKTGVPVRMWQYVFTDGANPHPAFDALNLDLNETSPDASAVQWMLQIP